MLKKTLFSLLIVALLGTVAFPQSAYTPSKDSLERKTILNALRLPVERELKQQIQFSIQHFKVQGNWAFVNGEPLNKSNGKPDYRNTRYQQAIEDGIFDNNFQALLKKTNGKWKVVTYQIGCTDVCWFGWDEEYKAPKTIFPPTG